MAIIKCKMCGGDLVLVEGQSVAECEYCGSRQTVPTADNEKKMVLFERAERLRKNCEFDKAAGIYETIVTEFRTESEAYWGLVLCKYGIEYVDDPATGKKIPTCHRSSFDSILEDSDFDQACENADAVARKVYREEAKQIEEIRKGIIEVSGKEQPYDIFICYKETDENGERTLDSVLAQDVYDALTDKGYRVFFSRITLEDKLGQEYEPYIFAALNSAKIMLAFGTDYEYYNSVWVKNEWSRFLKLMEKDKTKHLIPCYKGIDAYDMPREFAKLQAQDMGKVGAMQDLLRGIEKLLPKAEPAVPVVQEKVVVGNAGGSSKIASLLDRGNMALEDGDWAKADSFFEDVLNNDSKNAQAYIGKTLAQEKCRTMDALVRKRRDVHQNVSPEKLYIKAKDAHIREMAEKYSLPGYVEPNTIRELYRFDLSYTSEVSNRQKQYREEESWWANHKQLSRAEKFATGAVAEHLQNEKKHLFAQLNDRVKKAQEADARAVAKLEATYDAHIAEADKQAEKNYETGLSLREKYYLTWLEEAKKKNDIKRLKELAASFIGLGDYQDSKNLAEHCLKRAAEEQAKIDAEKERQRVIAERKRKAQQKRNKTIAMIAVACVVLAVAVTLVVTKVIIPGNVYKKAEALAASDDTYAAAKAFAEMGDYKDARERSFALWAEIADRQTISAGEYHAVGLRSDGTVVAVGDNDHGSCNVSNWTDIVSVSAGNRFTIGLRNDGTVVAAKNNIGYNYGQCNVDSWTDIVAVDTGVNFTVGLRNDGTVVAVGSNDLGQCYVSSWMDIVSVSAGGAHTVGLRSDGTVVAVGNNKMGECDVEGWSDIVAVSAGNNHTVGIKSDGTVVSTGRNEYGQCDVNTWDDIVEISAGSQNTVGLRNDGTVVAAGEKYSSEWDVSGWTDIVAISAPYNTIGLRSDGSVIIEGYNYGGGKFDVSNWTDIKLPMISEDKQAAMDAARQKREARLAAEKKAEEERLAKEYAAAEELAKNGETAKAAMEFYKLGDSERSRELWRKANPSKTLVAGGHHTVGLKSDGMVLAIGQDAFGKTNVGDWTDIKEISASADTTVGLKTDGTVIVTGSNSWKEADAQNWSDIVSISDGHDHIMGLKADGTVVALGRNDGGQCNVSGWEDVAVICAGGYHSVGLKQDGTVVATGVNLDGRCDVSSWTDIAAVGAGNQHTVGLKLDGTVIATGYNAEGQCNVSDWKDIVAIAAGAEYTVGLKEDGTVVATGKNSYGQCDVGNWRDIVAVNAGIFHTVGLKTDGTAVAVGWDYNGQCRVSRWRDIQLP